MKTNVKMQLKCWKNNVKNIIVVLSRGHSVILLYQNLATSAKASTLVPKPAYYAKANN